LIDIEGGIRSIKETEVPMALNQISK
jgi:hypothetical protein